MFNNPSHVHSSVNYNAVNSGGGTQHNFGSVGNVVVQHGGGGDSLQRVQLSVDGEVSVDGESAPCEDGTVTIEVREGFVHVNGMRTASNSVNIKIKGSVNSVDAVRSSVNVTGDVRRDVTCKQGSVRVGGDVDGDVSCPQGSVRVAGSVGGDVTANQGSIRVGRQ